MTNPLRSMFRRITLGRGGEEKAVDSALARASLSVLVSTLLGQLIMAVTYATLARSYPPEEVGRALAVLGVTATVTSIADFGSSSLISRDLASGEMSVSDALARIAGKAIVVLTVGLIASAFLIYGWHWHPNKAVLPTLGAMGLTLSLGYYAILRGKGRTTLGAWMTLTEKLLTLGAVVTFFQLGASCMTALLAGLALSPVLVALPVLLTVGKGSSLWNWRAKSPYRGALGFGVSSVAASSQTLDVPLIASISGAYAAGQYGAVSRWMAPLSMMVSAYLQPAMSELARQESFQAAFRIIRGSLKILGLSWVIALTASAASPLIVPLVLDPEYAQSVRVYSILALATIPSGVSQLALVLLQSQGRERQAGAALAGGMFGQIGLIAVGCSIGDAEGGALALVAAQVFLALCLSFMCGRVLRAERRSVRVDLSKDSDSPSRIGHASAF